MNKLILSSIGCLIFAAELWADTNQPTSPVVPVVGETNNPVSFTTKDGRKFENAKVTVTDTGLSVLTPDGGASIAFDQLPDDISGFSAVAQAKIKARRNALAATPQVNNGEASASPTPSPAVTAGSTQPASEADSTCARLGESMDVIIKRHAGDRLTTSKSFARLEGNVTSLKVDVIEFTYSGFGVRVTCLNGTSCEERFTKKGPAPISVEEANVLLAANAQGHTWKLQETPTARTDRHGITSYYGGAKWLRDDNGTASVFGGTLYVSTGELTKAATAAHQADSGDNIQGF